MEWLLGLVCVEVGLAAICYGVDRISRRNSETAPGEVASWWLAMHLVLVVAGAGLIALVLVWLANG